MGAYDQQVVRIAAGVQAGGPGIDGVEPMDQAFFDQEVQRAIDRGRNGAGLHAPYFVEQFVGIEAAALTQQDFKYLEPDGRSEQRRVGKECVRSCRTRW